MPQALMVICSYLITGGVMKGANINVCYLKQEGKQCYTGHVVFCLCQRAVWFLDVHNVHLCEESMLEYTLCYCATCNLC